MELSDAPPAWITAEVPNLIKAKTFVEVHIRLSDVPSQSMLITTRVQVSDKNAHFDGARVISIMHDLDYPDPSNHVPPPIITPVPRTRTHL